MEPLIDCLVCDEQLKPVGQYYCLVSVKKFHEDFYVNCDFLREPRMGPSDSAVGGACPVCLGGINASVTFPFYFVPPNRAALSWAKGIAE